MTLNCKLTDLAVIITPPLNGKLVRVIERCPAGAAFRLPDGYPHGPVGPGYWVIESLGSPFDAPAGLGKRSARYATAHDRHLRPLRGELVGDEVCDGVMA